MATLKELREGLVPKKSRARVAADLEMSERHLYRLENGYPISRVLALAFANYYGVPVELIEGVGNEAAA